MGCTAKAASSHLSTGCFCTSSWNFLNRVLLRWVVAVIIIIVVVDWRLLIVVISVLVDVLCIYSLYPSCHRSFFFFLPMTRF